MYRDVPRATLDLFCHINDNFRIFIFFIELIEFRDIFQCFFDRHRKALRSHRDHFCDLVGKHKRETHCPRNIAACPARHHGAEGSNLRHIFFAVFSTDVVDHFIAPVVGEVHIDIGSRRSFRIEKSLKGKLIFKRIDFGDLGQIGGERSSDRTSDVGENTMLVGIFEQVVHDKEILRIALVLDDLEFILKPVSNFFCFYQTPFFNAFVRDPFQFFIMRAARSRR